MDDIRLRIVGSGEAAGMVRRGMPLLYRNTRQLVGACMRGCRDCNIETRYCLIQYPDRQNSRLCRADLPTCEIDVKISFFFIIVNPFVGDIAARRPFCYVDRHETFYRPDWSHSGPRRTALRGFSGSNAALAAATDADSSGAAPCCRTGGHDLRFCRFTFCPALRAFAIAFSVIVC